MVQTQIKARNPQMEGLADGEQVSFDVAEGQRVLLCSLSPSSIVGRNRIVVLNLWYAKSQFVANFLPVGSVVMSLR